VKVLLAVDGSPHAEQAVKVLQWCNPGFHVEILHVLDLEATPHPHLSASLIEEYHRELRTALQDEASRFLSRFQALLSPASTEMRVSVHEGRAAEVILQRAASSQADLIVLGSRGLSEIQSLLLGSVSYRVAHEARRPVLLVKRGSPAAPKILLAVDRSEGADRAVRFLAEQSLFPPSPLTALTVCPSPPFVGLLPESARQYGQASASDYLKAVKERLSARGYEVEPRIVEGDPAAAILAHAAREGIDLVVMGARGFHGMKRWLLGSISRKVLVHTSKSVLIVPAGPGQTVAG
jgi:nucleotide-binding universal stress UspA family protein